jgi:glycerophosphoryl diester phosphodiesterase
MTKSPLGPGPLVYAHRGDRSHADDNTLKAYSLAVEAGASGIELDVRRTRDGVLILSHDNHREGLDAFPLLDFSLLRELAPEVPTLREAMEVIPRNIFVNVEIKNFPHEAGFDVDRRIVDETIAELRSYDDPERILLSSFDPVSMQRAGQVGPEILRGLLVLATVQFDIGLATARELAVDALHPAFSHMQDDPAGRMDEIRAAGLAAVVWSVNTLLEITSMARASVDVVITDDPGRAQEILDHL